MLYIRCCIYGRPGPVPEIVLTRNFLSRKNPTAPLSFSWAQSLASSSNMERVVLSMGGRNQSLIGKCLLLSLSDSDLDDIVFLASVFCVGQYICLNVLVRA